MTPGRSRPGLGRLPRRAGPALADPAVRCRPGRWTYRRCSHRPPPAAGRRPCWSCSGTARTGLTCCSSSAATSSGCTRPARLPGGAIDAPGDGGPVGAALREAAEEVGLDLAGVDVVGILPEVFIERTGFRVVPVLAWWREPSAVAPVDAAEVAAVERVSVAELGDPATRLMLRLAERPQQPGVPRPRDADLGVHRGAGGSPARRWVAGEAVGRRRRRRLVKYAQGLDNGENALPLGSCAVMCSTSS